MFEKYLEDSCFTGDVVDDALNLLELRNRRIIFEHVQRVAETARRMAKKYGVSIEGAEVGAILHDISGVIPNNEKIELAERLGLDILKEERECPAVIHQKISRGMAEIVFGIEDKEILSAIECHTTLKARASRLDKIIFLADKISWDQEGKPPYLDNIMKGLSKSLDEGVRSFLEFQWKNKSKLKVIHPWLEEACLYYLYE